MFTAADLIDALRRRRRRSIRPEDAPDGLPAGWARWFETMRARVGAVTGATADAIVAVLVARPAPPRRKGRVPKNALAAWLSLMHPRWEPESEDHRGPKRVSWALALLVQVLWVSGLLLLTQAHFAVPAPAAQGEQQVVQAVFIGDGTPEDAAAGDEGEPVPVTVVRLPPAPTSNPAPSAPQPAPAAPQDTSAPQDAVVAAEPVAPTEQVLQVTQTPVPDIDFTLPPPRPGAAPEVAVRDRQVPEAQLQAVEVPALRTPAPLADVTAQQRQVEIEVRDRSVPQPTETLRLPTRDAPSVVVDAPEIPVRPVADIVARERAVPLREAPAPTAAAQSPASAPVASAPSPRPPTPAAPGSRTPAPGRAAGAGTRAGTPPGDAPSSRVADDWGDGATARDGGQPGSPSGLLDADGRPRLAGNGRVGGGLPPGTVMEDFARIDREGTWLKRPPTDYEPTSFDRFWTPSETLLEEWVRRSIKTVLIPIPGTSKTIQCNVALLAFGGGCGITDPNMQDVETDGRPPPDVPWKPELQEDQDSLGG
ncbi:conserved hypothetical protein [Luteimonas sp. 9C]|uniref:hypothetical protein n=1 Tax=Luteimonas sp. 9C TaxID=2653148 RepID=UPI0012EEE48A|nr:hypothetical protein [Luteimonas sp. 9C]VXB55453.1 conserved hypothetical protein [Luteimonas sp. 9C]